MEKDIQTVQEWVHREAAFIETLLTEVRKVIIGQEVLLERILIGLLTRGHLLLEGVPGLAKTLTVSAFAEAMHGKFKRLQFTPDLLPADLTGTLVFDQRAGTFTPHKGPIFANLVLADEINRAPAKVQSALLESMQERQVTIGDTTYPLPEPFLVLATQNPIEQEGTYPLPEAQTDRFLMKVVLGYPTPAEERLILDRHSGAELPQTRPVITLDQLEAARKVSLAIYVDDKLRDYIVRLVHATRQPETYGLDLDGLLQHGASPRASLGLLAAARAHAFIRGRAFVTPEDVKTIGLDVLRHRLILSFEAEAESVTTADVIAKVFDAVEVP